MRPTTLAQAAERITAGEPLSKALPEFLDAAQVALPEADKDVLNAQQAGAQPVHPLRQIVELAPELAFHDAAIIVDRKFFDDLLGGVDRCGHRVQGFIDAGDDGAEIPLVPSGVRPGRPS